MRPLSADGVRSSVETMRDAVRQVAAERAEVWVGPFDALVSTLTEVGRLDLCLGRLVEGHADAMRILDQAGATPRAGVYGVWASRSAGTGVKASPDGVGWRLSGESRFSSGIDLIDRALVPGWVDDDTHLLFDVDATAVQPDRTSWHTSAMDASRSFTVGVDVAAREDDIVGPSGFYLGRPGFAVGGLEVAAVWLGGAQCVVDEVVAGLRRFSPTASQLRRVGAMEQALWQARVAVDSTVRRLPDLHADALDRETAAARTAVVETCERVVDEAGRIVGPGGLSGNARLARTLADLTIYARQHHVDLTLQSLGSHTLREHEEPG